MIDADLQGTAGPWAVPDGFGQGKGVFGGLLAGRLVNAATGALADRTRALRALTMAFIAPPDVGPATITVEPLREGAGSTTVDVRLLQGGAVKTQSTMVFSKPRPSSAFTEDVPVIDPAWEQVEIVPVAPPMAPVFATHFEYRPTGAWPFSGGTRAETSGWVRPVSFSGHYDAALVTACADAWWHSLHVRATTIRPALTVTFALELYGDPASVPANAPLFHHGVTWAVGGGYASERRTLWTPAGALLAVNHQSIAVLG